MNLPRLAAAAPAAALLAASFALSGTLPHFVVPAIVAHAMPFDAGEAETVVCQLRSGRSWDECDGETEGKALIRDAELALAAQPRAAARPVHASAR